MKLLVTVLTGLCLFAQPSIADEARGLEIATDRKARDTGWGDSEAHMTMILRNAQGEESIRKMRFQSFEINDDGDKGLTIFDEPKDVKGTAFLNFSHVDKSDDQWLYLPALKRVKRISSRNKSGPFMGSEFAYEDMSSYEPEKYKFNYLRDAPCGEWTCHVLESIPVDENSGYTKQITWLDTEHLRPVKTEYYDRKDTLLKTLEMSEWHVYSDRYWRAEILDMQNHQNGKSTRLITSELNFNIGLKEDDFSQATLQRAR
jgi:outer membrane lipoprotein-sorting protein